jgi:hypothetical protein
MQIKIDTTALQKEITYWQATAKGQMRFAIAKGLTDLAKAAQQEVIDTLPSRFTIRNTWYKPNTPLGFKIKMATKENLQSEVYSTASFLGLQEEGGTKRSISGHRIAIPTDQVRRNKKDIIPRSQRPAQISKLFPIKSKGRTFLVKRITRGTQKGSLSFLYQLRTSTNIKPRLQFHETCQQIADRKGTSIMETAIQYALDTAKK